MNSLKDCEAGRFPARDQVVDNETGIIRWVSEIPIDPGEPEIFNYSVKMCNSAKYFPVGCYDSNGGAGLTREAAYRAAIGEAIERYCCSVFFPEDLILGSYVEVQAHTRALHPQEIALFHPKQKDAIRYAWFTEDVRLCWTRGYSLTAKEPILIPACLVYIPYYPFRRHQGEQTIAPSVSTGQASASTSHAALLNGIYEIVERDAFMVSWFNRLPISRIDIDSSPTVSRIFHQRFERNNLSYALYRMATDLEIPAILCLIIDYNRDPPMICCGGAANLDPERAALKALVEAAQTREWAKFLGNQPQPIIIESNYSNIDDFEKHVFLYAYADMLHAVAFLLESRAEIRFSEMPNLAAGHVTKDLRDVMWKIASKGYEIMVVELTTPDVRECGYSVVKMLIPQMQPMEGDHSHRFLGGTRLFEVPRKLGYAIEPGLEVVNPYPHPYP
jgi:ribosomal protein S12 methylthiotransferase accessory factor